MIIIHAFIKVKPESKQQFLRAADKVMEGSKAEEGNISYHLYEDVKDPSTFVMVEEWKDKDATTFHRETEHYKAFGKEIKEHLAKPNEVKIFEAEKLS